MPAANPPQSSIVLYQTEDGRARVECRFEDETIWLSQALMAELYQKDVRTINEHLANIFEEGELDRGATIRNFRIVRLEGALPPQSVTRYRRITATDRCADFAHHRHLKTSRAEVTASEVIK